MNVNSYVHVQHATPDPLFCFGVFVFSKRNHLDQLRQKS